jgi:hypothetical protein
MKENIYSLRPMSFLSIGIIFLAFILVFIMVYRKLTINLLSVLEQKDMERQISLFTNLLEENQTALRWSTRYLASTQSVNAFLQNQTSDFTNSAATQPLSILDSFGFDFLILMNNEEAAGTGGFLFAEVRPALKDNIAIEEVYARLLPFSTQLMENAKVIPDIYLDGYMAAGSTPLYLCIAPTAALPAQRLGAVIMGYALTSDFFLTKTNFPGAVFTVSRESPFKNAEKAVKQVSDDRMTITLPQACIDADFLDTPIVTMRTTFLDGQNLTANISLICCLSLPYIWRLSGSCLFRLKNCLNTKRHEGQRHAPQVQ